MGNGEASRRGVEKRSWRRRGPGTPDGTDEPVLPVALVLNKSLLKKIVIAVVIAAAETVLSGPANGKVKR
jgi:hypothetical protein